MIRPSSTPVEHTRKSYQGILKSAALLGSARVMTLVIGLARVKALAVLIGPVGVGLIGTYDVLVQMAIYVFGMGVQASGVRQVAIANSQQDPDRTARNVISDRIEAMKVLLPDLAGRQELAARFLREIKLMATLNHPNIAVLRTAFTADNRSEEHT